MSGDRVPPITLEQRVEQLEAAVRLLLADGEEQADPLRDGHRAFVARVKAGKERR